MILKGCVSSEMIATGKGVACQCYQLSFMPTTSFEIDIFRKNRVFHISKNRLNKVCRRFSHPNFYNIS